MYLWLRESEKLSQWVSLNLNGECSPNSALNSKDSIRRLRIWVWVQDQVQERLFNSSFQASHYHNSYPSYPISHPLCLKRTWRARALEASLVQTSRIVLALHLVLIVQSIIHSLNNHGLLYHTGLSFHAMACMVQLILINIIFVYFMSLTA